MTKLRTLKYSGMQAKLTYGNSFNSDVTSKRVDLTAGLNLEDGKTNVLLAGSYSDANSLTNGERNLTERGRQHILANNPGFFFDGTPPLGRTPNIRSSAVVNGVRQNLTLDDGTQLNSTFTYIPEGYAGRSVDGGAALVANAGQYNLELADTAQLQGKHEALLSSPKVKSVLVTVRREFSPRIQAFLDLNISNSETARALSPGLSGTVSSNVVIPAGAPNNPFQQSIIVSAPAVGVLDGTRMSKSEQVRAVSGLIMRLPRDWQAELDVIWHRSRSSYRQPGSVTPNTLAEIRSGSLDILRDVNVFPLAIETSPIPRFASSPAQTTMKDSTLRAAGSLPWSLQGGKPVISALLEHREELLAEFRRVVVGTERLVPSRSQSVNSAYLEAQVPLVSRLNRIAGVELLELQIAARWDDYDVNGVTNTIVLEAPEPIVRLKNEASSIDPTIALRYSPVPDLIVRASYGTGYLPPSVTQLIPTEFELQPSDLVDPLRGNEPLGQIVFLSGGNPNLQPESSRSWSGGIVFTPRWVPGLRISADWSQVEKSGNIGFLDLLSQSGLNSGLTHFPKRITRGPPSDGFSVGPITQLDASAINVARLQAESVDLTFDYRMETTRVGDIDFSMRATHLISHETQDTPSLPLVDNVGVLARLASNMGGLKWTATSSVTWAYGGWDLGWRARYFDSYFLDAGHTVLPNQGSSTVRSQIYHDVLGGYQFPSSSTSNLLADVKISFGISNVFNKKPPVDVSLLGYYYSPLGDPRLANYYVSVTKSFLRN